MKKSKFDIRVASRKEVIDLFEKYHGYKSLSASLTYCFAVFENDSAVAAFAWQPPPPGAAKAVCPEAPQGVLALSRMVAVPKDLRQLKHISKPLRVQMRDLIDRTRWPVLITYSDEGQVNHRGEPHNGFVYQCSGWTRTIRNKRPIKEDADGRRCSSYSSGKHGTRELIDKGYTWVQRWENRICEAGQEAVWMRDHGWVKVEIPGKQWASGKQAYTYIRQ